MIFSEVLDRTRVKLRYPTTLMKDPRRAPVGIDATHKRWDKPPTGAGIWL